MKKKKAAIAIERQLQAIYVLLLIEMAADSETWARKFTRSPSLQCIFALLSMVLFSIAGGAVLHALEFDAEKEEAARFANATKSVLRTIKEGRRLKTFQRSSRRLRP